MKNLLFLAFAFSFLLNSCVDDPDPMCFQDPRAPFAGDYAMTDSVFFLDSFNEIREYTLSIQIDTLRGDTVVLNNLFDAEFGFDPYALLSDGDFIIPAQKDQDANVSGSGFIAGDLIEYTAEYDDGGYSFKGTGIRN